MSIVAPLKTEPSCVSVQEPIKRTPSALTQNKNQFFIVHNVMINIFCEQKEYLSTSTVSVMEGVLCLSVYAFRYTGANIFIRSREIGKFSSEYERGTNTLPVVTDSQNLFQELLLPEFPG